ncbi:MAG: hypothetical protein IKZ19_07475 [Clostridia bacterium]|nr:hypothetical protein [Clostridia bacterium]
MDIKAKIEEIVEKLKSDKDLMKKFKEDPSALIKEYIGVDIPEEQLEQVVDAVKAKVSIDKISGALGGLFKK